MVEKDFTTEHYSYKELYEEMTAEELYEAQRKLERMIRDCEDELYHVKTAFRAKRKEGY